MEGKIIEHSSLLPVKVWISAAKNSQKQKKLKAVDILTMRYIHTVSVDKCMYISREINNGNRLCS